MKLHLGIDLKMKVTKINTSKRRRNIHCIRLIQNGLSIFSQYADDGYTIREFDSNNCILIYEYNSWFNSTFDVRPVYYNLKYEKIIRKNISI